MKLLSLFFLCLLSLNGFSQSKDSDKNYYFGAALNSSISGSTGGSVILAPTGTFYANRHQIEFGVNIYPFVYGKGYDNLIGGEINYKYFPNGIKNRFNLYFVASSTYHHDSRSGIRYDYSNYPNQPSTYSYESSNNNINLLGGYGFQLKILQTGYVGTCIQLGAMTSSYHYNNSKGYTSNYNFFRSFDLDGAIKLNVGYRL